MAVGFCTNLVLLNRVLPFVAMLLEGSPSGVSRSVEEHERVWQLPIDRRMSEIGEDRSREVCTRILNAINQWGLLSPGWQNGGTREEHRH
jgi:hypothetical protein